MIVDLGYSHARVVSALGWERRWLEDYLSFTQRRYSPSKGYAVEETTTVVTSAGGFPAGFAPLVARRAAEDCVRVEWRDTRTKPCEWDASFEPAWLRDHQREAFEVARAHERGIFQAPTAAGKTEGIVALCTALPCAWLVATHRLSLVGQLRERFALRTGEEVGQVGDGVFDPRRVTVGTFDSVRALMRRKERDREARAFLDSVGGCFVDEVHVAGSRRNRFVLSHLPRCYWRFGTSATPLDRSDGRNALVIGAVGPVIHKVARETLVERGLVSEGSVVLVPVPHEPCDGSWTQVYRRCVAEDLARLRATIAVARAARKPALLFVKEVEHGRRVEKAIRAAGMQAEFAWGAKNVPQRLAAIRRLMHGDVDVLVCNVIFQEGVDMPALRSVIYASGGKSIIAQLQSLGRGSRVTEDKREFEVYDLLDQGCGCNGARHRSCRWFEDHARKRRKTYLGQGYSVSVNEGLSR